MLFCLLQRYYEEQKDSTSSFDPLKILFPVLHKQAEIFFTPTLSIIATFLPLLLQKSKTRMEEGKPRKTLCFSAKLNFTFPYTPHSPDSLSSSASSLSLFFTF